MTPNIRKSLLFIELTLFVSWLMIFLFLKFGGRWHTNAALATTIGYMFVPMTVAIFVQKIICKESIRDRLRISFKLNRWFLVAWLLPPVIAFATFAVSLLFLGVKYSPEMTGMFELFRSALTPEKMEAIKKQVETLPIHPIWIVLLQGLIAGVTVNAVAGFGEELGWRGLLQRELGHIGFWRSSFLIGIVWGIWHAPIIIQGHNYPYHPRFGIFMMIVWCLLLAPMFSYVTLRAKSVIAAAIMHGSLNGTVGLAIILVKGGSDLTIGVTGLAGFIILAFVNVGILVYDRLLAEEPVTTGSPKMADHTTQI